MFGIALFPGLVWGSVLVPATLADLAHEADAVVYARVAGVDVQQAPGSLRVERLVTLEVVRSAKGSWPSTLRITVPGGTLGRYQTIVPGAPALSPGDEALFFLRAHGTALPQIIGLSQGLARIVVDPASGRRMVQGPPDAIVDGRVRRGDAARAPVALAELEGRLAALLASPRPAAGARR